MKTAGGRMKLIIAIIKPFKLDDACASDIADRAVEAIQQSANTGAIGDGKIFVLEIEQVVRIRTGETNNNAL
jgi:nitrogen regulatory protein P-II 2